MPVDTPFRVEWIQLTGKDEPAEPGAVELALTRYETEWVVEEVNHHPTWKAVKNAIPISTRTIEADAATTASINSASITCPIAGQYELKILDRKSSGTASLTFYASNWNSELNTIAFNRPDRLDVVLDQESYAPGATAKAIVRSPFGGTLLLTIETDHVIDRRVVDLTENTGQIEFPVPSNLRGGAFVAASVVRAIDPASKDWLPHRAMGLTRLKIDPLEYHMAIALNAPEKVEPGESLTVDVKTDPPADPAHPGMVHVWAVDEGILLNTAYATPDPIKHFLAARKLAVKSSDVFSDLMPDNERPETVDRIGADGDGDWQYRNPIQSKARESAVIWRGIAALDADGHTSLRMTMPKMTGEMRLMAVAAAGDRYGSAHRAVTLSSPLMIELGCPRFAAPGDLFALPVKVFNGTDRATTVTLNLTAEGPLTFDPSAATMSLFLNPNQPDQFWLKCEAGQSGEARIKITGASSNGGETMAVASAEGNFPIRPIAPIEVDTQLISVKAGEEIEIKPPLGFLPDSMRSRVSVSGSPAVQLRPALERLVEYPYGCIEQTTSKLLGMLYAPEIIGADFPDDIRERSIRSMVNAGIARIWSMQTPSGGLSYWPGNTDPYPWGTVYASDCLLEASRAGYEVDKRLTDTLADYLENALKDNPAQGGGDVFNDDNTRAQVCYVLAGFNRPQKGWMSRLSEQLDRLDTAGRAHLAAAWLA
ncbi:hypothetical protein HY256_01490, partial [Candidatus Sumerlaeota bacterium]|nr:hypothetical protein [Candidatus Sumerlaeota bacterium]